VRASTADRPALARTFARAASRYWLGVFPAVRREIRHWSRLAGSIPDAALRALALESLESKWGNLEGAAAFAVLAPAANRPFLVRACVAWQAAYDYADTIMEQPCRDRAANADALHGTLLVAVTPGAPHGDYYAHHTGRDDRGYTAALVDGARTALAGLPAYGTVIDLVQLNARRVIGYQTRIDRQPEFAAWATGETLPDSGLRWWETGAACGSSMSVFALIALAADPGLTRNEALAAERAYFPWIGALHTLLDSLADRREDIHDAQHSLVGHYASTEAASRRMATIAAEAVRRAQALRDGTTHALILSGMASLYLSSPDASLPDTKPSRDRIADVLGDLAAPTMIVLGLRRVARRFHAGRRAAHDAVR
jgi:tetraprenyl-beta-curcumene synthase